ncbi:MAG: N-acetylmuramoyl-L-alanine amidase [Truepera sp.]|nr:N-acetylmuramoyl-L-alanine amidase [Truepera sp.]
MSWGLGKRSGALFLLLGLCLATAQERANFLGVNGEFLDEAGPYYFIGYGDRENAFAKAAPLAEALGLALSFDNSSKELTFRQGDTVALLQATGDITQGLVKRSGVFSVNGRSIDSPMGILVDGTAYVAITPIVSAFGGESDWYPDETLIAIRTADQLPVLIPAPRIGFHSGDSGEFTRVVLDLPVGQERSIAVERGLLVVTLPGVRGDPYTLADAENLESLTFRQSGPDLLLIVRPRHAIDPDGNGFRFGEWHSPDRVEVLSLYIDFAPGLHGEPVETLIAESPSWEGLGSQKTVVIDPGHGGHDPGASSTFAIEEEIVFDIALRLKKLLENEGIEVILTRDRDAFYTLQERSAFATPHRNLFVSIHANAAPNPAASGIETWVFGYPLDPSLIDQAIRENGGGAVGEALTQEVLELISSTGAISDFLKESQFRYSCALAQIVQDRMVEATGANDRGVRQNAFYVISTARIPAILVEVGFVSNEDEGSKLATADYRSKLAAALADGIEGFLAGGGGVLDYLVSRGSPVDCQ